MRKFIAVIIVLFSLSFITMEVSAEEISYRNLITDETTIAEDFKLLNMNIEDYYQPSFISEKWYVVGMSEAYVNSENYDIQTYFYIYNPMSPHSYEYYDTEEDDGEEYYNQLESFGIKYLLGNQTLSTDDATVLNINYEHHLYKIKAFTYSYRDRVEISILEIHNNMTFGNRSKSNESTFKATASHSKLDGLSVELTFNSTIIIDELECISLDVLPESNFGNWFFGNVSFKEFVTKNIIDKKLRLYFYNFNFPKNIQPDSIEYAKFSYYKENWEKERKRVGSTAIWHWEEVRNEKASEQHVISEYFPGTHKFQVGKYSEELEFETFVLGNRIEKEQHGYLEFSEEQKKSFNYDCSILLDNEYVIVRDSDGGTVSYSESTNYTKLRDVDFLELWYKKDGIIYKCQVVSHSPEDEYKGEVGPDLSWWEKLLLWLGKLTLQALRITATLPEWGYMIIGGVEVLVAAVVTISFLPQIISLIIFLVKLPFKIFKS